jgi:hypothetical protein
MSPWTVWPGAPKRTALVVVVVVVDVVLLFFLSSHIVYCINYIERLAV